MNPLIPIVLMFTAPMATAQTATGTLTLQGKAIEMRHAAAIRVPDFFDKTKEATRLVISSTPIPAAALSQDMELFSLARAGKFDGVQFEFGAGSSTVNLSILSNKLDSSISGSRSFDVDAVKIAAGMISGKLAIEPSKLGDMSYQYDFSFSAPIAPQMKPEVPTPADKAAAAKAPSAQAYLAFVAALRSGNKAKLLELSSPNVRKMIDQPDFAENIAFIQSMEPTDIQVLKATETGDEAKLIVTGKEKGVVKNGTVTMLRQNGKWLMVKESWTSRG